MPGAKRATTAGAIGRDMVSVFRGQEVQSRRKYGEKYKKVPEKFMEITKCLLFKIHC